MSVRPVNTPRYRLHKPSGRAVVSLDGRDYYLGVYGTDASRAEYDRVVADWLANGRRRQIDQKCSCGLTINELLLAYLCFAERYYRKNGKLTSEYACIRSALKPLQQIYGTSHCADFGPLRLKAVREKMVAMNLSRGVVNALIGRIKRIFRWAVENELVSGEVSHALAAVSGLRKGRSEARETEPVKPVSDSIVDVIKAHVSPQVWAMIELQRLTGMRPGEVRLMRTCDLDMGSTLWEYRPMAHKTEHHGHTRIVPLGARAQAILTPFLKPDLNAFLFSPQDAEAARNAARRQNRKTPMTPSQQRRRPEGRSLNPLYTKDSYVRIIRRACLKAGVPSWHPNQLRHNSGTRIRKELGLEAAQVWLGHANADVTQIYAERNLDLARQIAARFG